VEGHFFPLTVSCHWHSLVTAGKLTVKRKGMKNAMTGKEKLPFLFLVSHCPHPIILTVPPVADGRTMIHSKEEE